MLTVGNHFILLHLSTSTLPVRVSIRFSVVYVKLQFCLNRSEDNVIIDTFVCFATPKQFDLYCLFVEAKEQQYFIVGVLVESAHRNQHMFYCFVLLGNLF